MNHKGTYI
jgi:hypothetical protein